MTVKEPAKYWIYPPNPECDFVGREYNWDHTITTTFTDGATTLGPWAIMCPNCFSRYGRGLGLGVGQKYQKQPDGRFLKVEG